jgi:hypothetical protein
MKILFSLLCSNCLFVTAALAQSPVTLTIDARSNGYVIPGDFCGLSFGAVSELPGKGDVSGLLFSPTNSQLITLFTNSGIRNLRLGGSTVEGTDAARPSREAIDNVFGFAKAARIDVIYSLPLLNGNPESNADTAKYIWDNYHPLLRCFAIGNEPDIKRYHYPPHGTGTDPAITNYASYLIQWRKFADAVTGAVPEAKFAGPDAADSGKGSWTPRFATDEKESGIVALATQHFYVGGSPFTDASKKDKIPATEAIDKMLSPDWVERRSPSVCNQILVPVLTDGLPYRMTEADDYLKGVANASDAFASALWALDFLHWWAAHGASGVNFHNTEWLKTDTVYFDSDSGSYRINPKAYAIRAFDLGSHGHVESVIMVNKEKLNLTAYAVCDTTNLYVTIINKEHGTDARAAIVKIKAKGFSSEPAEVMFLKAPGGDVGAKDGITLGNAPIVNNDAWRGQWTQVDLGEVTVPAASAAIFKLTLEHK